MSTLLSHAEDSAALRFLMEAAIFCSATFLETGEVGEGVSGRAKKGAMG